MNNNTDHNQTPRKMGNKDFFAQVELLLQEGEAVEMLLVGTSMEPALHNHADKVRLTPWDGTLAEGEVYLYRYRGLHLLHRLVKVEEGRCLMRGDNCVDGEEVECGDVVAHMVAVERNGQWIDCQSEQWKRCSRRSLRCGDVKRQLRRTLSRETRRRLRPWYFVGLVLLMWLPLNGLAAMVPNMVFGLRADHLVHASVFVPCAAMLYGVWCHRRGGMEWLWLCSVAVGVVTEMGQLLLPYRGFDVNDLVANTLGTTLGWLALAIYRRNQKHNRI